MELFKNKYCILSNNEQNKIFDQIWSENTEYMSDENYKEIQLKTIDLFKKKLAKKMFIDVKKFNFPIVPDLQKWTVENIINTLANAGILKIAYLAPTELFSQVSIEQTLKEDEEQIFPYKYFDKKESAMEWLTN